MKPAEIDIFCHVIDNYGDAGVVYRFAKELKIKHPLCRIRVFIDNLNTLHSIVPAIKPDVSVQQYQNIIYVDSSTLSEQNINQFGVADILVEAFACEIPEPVMNIALFSSKLILNLDYLSAEDWVEGYHLKQSLLNRGTAKKFFFMPGFTTATGGVVLNTEVLQNKIEYRKNRMEMLNEVLQECAGSQLQNCDNTLFGTVFTYERGFDNLLSDLLKNNKEIYLLVFGHKSHNSIRSSLDRAGVLNQDLNFVVYHNVHICFMPLISQERYDTLLCCCDFNLVRGEDSLVRAICAGKPFIWNAYIQDNSYQKVKVDAFLKVFRQYFDDSEVFLKYKETMQCYNDAQIEETTQKTGENYDNFLSNLNKIEHATEKMSYFIEENCNLIQKFSDFLCEFKID